MIYEEELSKKIIGLAIKVHTMLGSGFLEKVYENALCYEFSKNHLQFEQQKEVSVFYDNREVGQYIADIIVDNKIILELKAVKEIDNIHKAQLINYLKATNHKAGYVINFGSHPKLEFYRMIL